jgi:signal transduction histidine kinase
MFHSARLKLTAWYLLIIMLVSVSFSMMIYRVLTTEVERFALAQRYRIERKFRDEMFIPPDTELKGIPVKIPILDSELVGDTKHRIAVVLFIINGSILILSGGFGYLLAGRTLRPIQEMVDEQNRFISDSSHEFRTPITSLKSAMEVSLRDKKLTLKDSIKLIRENLEEVNRLQLLSDRLLQLAQYQKPNGNVRFELVSLSEIIGKVVRQLDPLAQQKKLKIQNNVKNIEIEADKFVLHDLFAILLDNAIKYSMNAQTITISSSRSDRYVSIQVKDEGIGIQAKDIPHIFDRFYRSDTARLKADTGGYGLGLSIAKKIVRSHHGILTVKSIYKKGSTFIVQLPIYQKEGTQKKESFS